MGNFYDGQTKDESDPHGICANTSSSASNEEHEPTVKEYHSFLDSKKLKRFGLSRE